MRADVSVTAEPRVRCPLCNHEFAVADANCQHGCPAGSWCRLIRCPNCQYEFPAEPWFVAKLRAWWRRRSQPVLPAGAALLSLPELQEGEETELVALHAANPARRNALAVYGLVPGSRLVLQQKRPTFVIRVGETELALEADIAREIVVKRPAS